MKNKDDINVDWATLQDKAQNILGGDFWADFKNLMPKRVPAIDLYETDDEGMIVVEVPGISQPEKLQIKLQGAHVKISGEIPYLYPVPKEQLFRMDRYFGPFDKTISIPFSFDQNKVKAAYKDGLLYIVLKKNNQIQSININIT